MEPYIVCYLELICQAGNYSRYFSLQSLRDINWTRTILQLLVVEENTEYWIINLNNPHTSLGQLHFDCSTSKATDTEQNSDNIPCEKYSCSIVHW